MASRRERQMQFRQLSPLSNDSPSPPSIHTRQEEHEELTAEGEPTTHQHHQLQQQAQHEQIPTSSATNEPPLSYFHAAAAGRGGDNGGEGDNTGCSFPFGSQARPSGEDYQPGQQPHYQQHHQQQQQQQFQPGQQQQWPQMDAAGYSATGFNIPSSYSTATTATLNAIRNPFEQEEEEYAMRRRAKSTPPYATPRGDGFPSWYEVDLRWRRQAWPKLPEHQHPMNPRSRLPYAFGSQLPPRVPYPVPGVGPGPMSPMVRLPPLHIYQQMMLQRGLHPAMLEHAGRFPPGHPAHMLGHHPNAVKMMGPPPPECAMQQQQQQRCDSVPAAPPQSKPPKKRTGPKKQQAAAVAKSGSSPQHQQQLQSQRFAQPPHGGGFPPAHPAAGPMHFHPALQPMTVQRFQDLDACRRCNRAINNQPGIRCTALNQGCGGSFHMECAELTLHAYEEFRREPRLEWICHQCFYNKPVILSM